MLYADEDLAQGYIVATKTRLKPWPGGGGMSWWPLGNSGVNDTPLEQAWDDLKTDWISIDYRRALQVCNDPTFVARYVELCRDQGVAGISGLIAARDQETKPDVSWVDPLASETRWMGYDVIFGNGTFSFIDHVLPSGNELAHWVRDRVNAENLFDSVAHAREFLKLYVETVPVPEWEDPDGAMIVALWEDVGAAAFLRMLPQLPSR